MNKSYKKYREEWAELYSDGWKMREIAEEFGCCESTVSVHLQDYDGIKTRNQKTFGERFWERVDIREKDECWEWQAGMFTDGYGCFVFKGEDVASHRVSLILEGIDIPKHKFVCHHCDNKSCVNPNHLYVGTAKDNAIDRSERNRRDAPSGEDCNFSKLKVKDVNEIRNIYSNNEISQTELAESYNVTQTAISDIVNYNTWKHI